MLFFRNRTKRDDKIITISHSNLKKIKYKYKNGAVKATLTSFKGGRIVVEYIDVISVEIKKNKI